MIKIACDICGKNIESKDRIVNPLIIISLFNGNSLFAKAAHIQEKNKNLLTREVDICSDCIDNFQEKKKANEINPSALIKGGYQDQKDLTIVPVNELGNEIT